MEASSIWQSCLCLLMLAGGGIRMCDCMNTEVDALIAFKQRVTDPRNMLDTWDPTIYDPCTFSLVTCDESIGRVSELNLVHMGFSGSLAPQLGDLQYLRRLNLAENALHGPIPAELGNLKNIQHLVLSQNNLNGTIPTSFGNLQSLRILFLEDNHLTGTVPKEVTNLPNLILLNMTNNNLDP